MIRKLLALAGILSISTAAPAQSISGIGPQSSPLPSPPTLKNPNLLLSSPGGFGNGQEGDPESITRNNDRFNREGSGSSADSRIGHTSISSATARSLDKMFPDTRTTISVTNGPFAGLTTGVTLTSYGSDVGKVAQIRTGKDNAVALVIVESAKHGFYAVPVEKLTLSAGVLSTTLRLNGVNGATNTAMGTPSH